MCSSDLAEGFRPEFLVFMNDLVSNFDASDQSQFYEFFLTIKRDKNQFEREFSVFFHEYIKHFPNHDYDFDLESDIQKKFKNKHTFHPAFTSLAKTCVDKFMFCLMSFKDLNDVRSRKGLSRIPEIRCVRTLMLYKISLFFEKKSQQDENLINGLKMIRDLINELKMIRNLQLTKMKETIDTKRFKIQNPQFDSQVSSIVDILRSQNVDTLTNTNMIL